MTVPSFSLFSIGEEVFESMTGRNSFSGILYHRWRSDVGQCSEILVAARGVEVSCSMMILAHGYCRALYTRNCARSRHKFNSGIYNNRDHHRWSWRPGWLYWRYQSGDGGLSFVFGHWKDGGVRESRAVKAYDAAELYLYQPWNHRLWQVSWKIKLSRRQGLHSHGSRPGPFIRVKRSIKISQSGYGLCLHYISVVATTWRRVLGITRVSVSWLLSFG